MTQFQRVGRGRRVMFASAAIVALSLVGYGNAATASAPTPLAVGAEPALDLAGPAKGVPATGSGGGVASGEGSEKPTAADVPGKVVQDCWVGAPTTTAPDAPVKPTKDDGRTPLPVQTDPSMGVASGTAVGAKGGKPIVAPRPRAIALPELREGPNGIKGFVPSAVVGCSGPEPVSKPPVKKPPVGTITPGTDDVPVVTTCTDPPTDLPLPIGGGVSAGQPNPGTIEPDDVQPEDQPVEVRPYLNCVQSDGDDSVGSTDVEPDPGTSTVPGDSVGAQEAD